MGCQGKWWGLYPLRYLEDVDMVPRDISLVMGIDRSHWLLGLVILKAFSNVDDFMSLLFLIQYSVFLFYQYNL